MSRNVRVSIHGICFDNGMSGNCNHMCEQFLDGDCGVGDTIVENMLDESSPEEVEEALLEMIEPVKLFTLRGLGKTDLEILIEAFGYGCDV